MLNEKNQIVLEILQIASNLKADESISVEEVIAKLNYSEEDVMKTIIACFTSSMLAGDKYYFRETRVEKHSRIVGLDRDGYIALDILTNPEILNYFGEKIPGFEKMNIYTIILVFKKYL